MRPASLISTLAFFFALAGFGVWAFVFNVVSLPGLLLRRPSRAADFQRAVHRQIALLMRFLRVLGICEVEYRNWERLAAGPKVVVANHPGMLDAFYLLARIPHAFCIFKPSIRRNPFLAVVARRAGYLANDRGAQVVWRAAEQLHAGGTLVLFPEGTRTPPGRPLGVLRPGFAAIARRAGVPVQPIRVHVDRFLLGKGTSWWRLPELPIHVVVEVGPLLDSRSAPSNAALVSAVTDWLGGLAPAHLDEALTASARATLTPA